MSSLRLQTSSLCNVSKQNCASAPFIQRWADRAGFIFKSTCVAQYLQIFGSFSLKLWRKCSKVCKTVSHRKCTEVRILMRPGCQNEFELRYRLHWLWAINGNSVFNSNWSVLALSWLFWYTFLKDPIKLILGGLLWLFECIPPHDMWCCLYKSICVECSFDYPLEVSNNGHDQKVLDSITPVFNVVYLWSDQRKWILIQDVNRALK